MKATLTRYYMFGDTITVDVAANGTVTWEGEVIGHVRKGERTSSPPLYPGSRVAKYHKQVPCWYAKYPGEQYECRVSYDTRKDAIRSMMDRAQKDG